MSRSYIGAELRRKVQERARFLCEYCLIHEDDMVFGGEVDHVISEKHGGATTAENLAYTCRFCNRAKGSDIGTIVPGAAQFTRFFDPRRDRWSDHFALAGVEIVALTPVGEGTVRIFGLNETDRLDERALLIRAGRYPSAAASDLLAD